MRLGGPSPRGLVWESWCGQGRAGAHSVQGGRRQQQHTCCVSSPRLRCRHSTTPKWHGRSSGTDRGERGAVCHDAASRGQAQACGCCLCSKPDTPRLGDRPTTGAAAVQSCILVCRVRLEGSPTSCAPPQPPGRPRLRPARPVCHCQPSSRPCRCQSMCPPPCCACSSPAAALQGSCSQPQVGRVHGLQPQAVRTGCAARCRRSPWKRRPWSRRPL